MGYVLKNISTNRPIVCTLGDGETLRLFPSEEKQIDNNQYIDYFKTLSKKEILMVKETTPKELPEKGKQKRNKIEEE